MVLILTRIYTLLQRPNKNTNSLNNEHVNKEQTIIASSSIISSSDNILIELVEELYAHTKQSSTLAYEALLLLPKVNEWTLLSMTNIAQRKITMFLLMLSRFSVRFEESGNRLFLIADRK
ncbi:unnamed protein product [Rotaria sp. Silwood1]|nr:unnamed protein product [Rotaria sp. Silwood1]CAF1665327.1 unnamed protein product [Rotaria sp. Silwood1]